MDLLIDQLHKTYFNQSVLSQLTIDLKNISALALIGPSGSGKSTLLRLLAGLEPFDSGSLTLNGHALGQSNLHDFRKRIGFVFQDHNLFPHLSIEDNIYLVLDKVHGQSKKDATPKVDALLNQFDLYSHRHKFPREISGGQSQRASIVRALSIEPELILLDEPTSSLDPILTHEVLIAISELSQAHTDFVIVTHEIGFAKHVADHVIYMEDGRFIEHGTPEVFTSPQTTHLKHFLSKVLNFGI